MGEKAIAVILILSLVPLPELLSKPKILENGISEIKSYEKEAPNRGQGKKSKWVGKLMIWTMAIAVVGLLVYFFVINKPKYTLRVNVEGVMGSPISGNYIYKKGTQVEYNYTPQPGYKQLTVLLDGNPISASGKIEMNKDHSLFASALEVGKYTSVKYQIHYILKNYNAMQGVFSIQLRDENEQMLKRILWGPYNTPNPGFLKPNPTCEDAVFDKETTVDYEMQRTDIYLYQDYQVRSWDGSTNNKPLMCPSFEFSILSYTWEQGKADPGNPQVLNVENLLIDPVKDLFQVSGTLFIFRKEIKLEFVRPSNPPATPSF